MKQKDIAMLIVIVAISAIISLVVSKFVFSSPQNTKQTAAVVEVINSNFPQPDPRYFNANSVDPTQLIHIGNSTNSNPFHGATQP